MIVMPLDQVLACDNITLEVNTEISKLSLIYS